uniref:Uncharacterized protein n=1 Tax=Anguilla anguilla TaxID=7936 RepID=A0A0E9XSM9_ANGAN
MCACACVCIHTQFIISKASLMDFTCFKIQISGVLANGQKTDKEERSNTENHIALGDLYYCRGVYTVRACALRKY